MRQQRRISRDNNDDTAVVLFAQDRTFRNRFTNRDTCQRELRAATAIRLHKHAYGESPAFLSSTRDAVPVPALNS
jgi:hypothetical protein